jgi:hypothetical protein
MKASDIFCPKCGWRPGPGDRWVCTPDCGTVWNTFWTRGMCPGCARQWHLTQCLRCAQHSAHLRWYHDRHDVQPVRRRKRPVEKQS